MKKGGSESPFGRRNWKKRWFILTGSTLEFFEAFDLVAGIPINKMGSLNVLGAEIKILNHRERNFVFSVESESLFYLCAENEGLMKTWIDCLTLAQSGISQRINFTELYEIFGLHEYDEPTLSVVNKAYRKAALKAHPDKGGDKADFKKLNEAFEVLSTKLEEDEYDRNPKNITFEAVIQKGVKGIGFGMVVVEDPKKGYIYIKEVLPTMRLQQLDEEAGRELRKGDKLIKVENDDVSEWPLTRVAQRLNDYRCPVNLPVRLTFTRRYVPVTDFEDDFFERDEPPKSTAPFSQNSSPVVSLCSFPCYPLYLFYCIVMSLYFFFSFLTE